VSSLEKSSSQEWMFVHGKHVNDVYSTDDELLQTLDNISSIMLAANEDDNFSADMDSLSVQYVSSMRFLLFSD
jgi:hypothetical protein